MYLMASTILALSPGMRSQYAMNQGVIDYDLQALVDNHAQLTPEERERVLHAIDREPALRKRYDELNRQKRLLKNWWDENKKGALQ
jgi:hypothetical protein